MKGKHFLLWLLVCAFACKNKSEGQADSIKEKKFDKTKWSIQEGEDYPYRDMMLKDLMEDKKLTGIKQDSILKLLGSPTRSDTNYLFYRIAQKRVGYFPLHTKTLVLKFTKDNTVEWAKTHE